MAQTLDEQLTSVQAAITAIESGAQSFQIADRTYSRADLSVLYQREESLLRRIAKQTNGGGRSLAEF